MVNHHADKDLEQPVQTPALFLARVDFLLRFPWFIIQGQTGLPLLARFLDKDPQFLLLLISEKHVFFSFSNNPELLAPACQDVLKKR